LPRDLAISEDSNHTVQGVSFTYDRTQWKFLDDGVAKDFDALKKVADGDITVLSRSKDDKAWIVAYLMDNGPVRYYLKWTPKTGQSNKLLLAVQERGNHAKETEVPHSGGEGPGGVGGGEG